MELKNKIKEFRDEVKIDVKFLAEKLDLSTETIEAIEVGSLDPSSLIALKIAQYFKTTVEEIFSLDNGIFEVDSEEKPHRDPNPNH